MKSLRVTKIVKKKKKKKKNEDVWGELRAKKCFQRQPSINYLRLTLGFMSNSTLWEKFNFVFYQFFASIYKMLILAGRLGTRLSFYKV